MEVKFDSRTDCLSAAVSGAVSMERLIEALRKIFEVAREGGSGLILIDCSLCHGKLSTHERYTIGQSAVDYWLGAATEANWLNVSFVKPTPKIAMVGKPPLTDGFGAVVASNRGLKAKAFLEVPQALQWLGLPQ